MKRLSLIQRSVLEQCVKEGGTVSAAVYAPNTTNSLVRRGYLKGFSTGSYLDGYSHPQYFVTITDAGRAALAELSAIAADMKESSQ